jgi:hypothetical protein
MLLVRYNPYNPYSNNRKNPCTHANSEKFNELFIGGAQKLADFLEVIIDCFNYNANRLNHLIHLSNLITLITLTTFFISRMIRIIISIIIFVVININIFLILCILMLFYY